MRVAAVVAVVLTTGCTGGTGDPEPVDDALSGQPLALREVDLGRKNSGPDGMVRFDVEVLAGETSMLLTGFSDVYLSIGTVVDPNGEVVADWVDWNGAYSLTDAFYPWYLDVTLNWPVRAEDGPLVPGVYEVYVATTDYDYNYVEASVEATVQLKSDPDPAAGIVNVRIVYTEGLDADPGISGAVTHAVEVWKEVWAPHGLVLVETYEGSDASGDMDLPDSDNGDVLALAKQSSGQELMLLVGELIDDYTDTYGYAGGIPGPMVATGRSVVQVSWLVHAGPDGAFDNLEERLMGETMAHEIGHFMGLYHPVEGGWNYFDALEDTPECATSPDCEAALGVNLMYPFTLCYDNNCDRQDQLTPDQVASLQLYTGSL